jgi:hypothetical protein
VEDRKITPETLRKVLDGYSYDSENGLHDLDKVIEILFALNLIDPAKVSYLEPK